MIGDRWGVTDAEVARRYPCDEFVPNPAMEIWRGVTVKTTPERLWPWVAQIRLAPYSYDWIDNLGRRSPQRLQDVAEPAVGERFTKAAETIPIGRVVGVAVGQHLTGRMPAGVYMSYVLEPQAEFTRLLLKIAMARGRLVAPMLSVTDLVMARRQLLNFKRLAERPRLAHRPRGRR
jgi:hypothetical protein